LYQYRMNNLGRDGVRCTKTHRGRGDGTGSIPVRSMLICSQLLDGEEPALYPGQWRSSRHESSKSNAPIV
jgi:hypothetical protein